MLFEQIKQPTSLASEQSRFFFPCAVQTVEKSVSGLQPPGQLPPGQLPPRTAAT